MTINRKGFTLIELLMVVAIIGLLSTLAVIALGSAREKARDSKRLADLRQIQTALELHFTENSQYPLTTGSIELGNGNASCLNAGGFQTLGCQNAFMAEIPHDPSSFSYVYTSSEDGSTYTIQARLEGNVNGLSGQIAVTPSSIGVQQ